MNNNKQSHSFVKILFSVFIIFNFLFTSLKVSASNLDGPFHVSGVNSEKTYSSLIFQRQQNTPVLAKGSIYDGWKADALAAPAVIWDGTQYVMTISFWSIENDKWASGFFTSPDLKEWTYINNSLLSPTDADYILGNGGIEWFDGKYWLSYSHYKKDGTNVGISISYSNDLLIWTNVADPLVSGGFDSSLSINPKSGKLELWYVYNNGMQRVIHMQNSSNGITWTDRGNFLPADSTVYSNNFGEPSVFYMGSTRYITFDGDSGSGRNIIMAHSIKQDAVWVIDGIYGKVLSSHPSSLWEPAQVFDSSAIVIGNIDGFIPYMLYAGSDNFSAGDNTNSSIGLAFAPSFSIDSSTYCTYQKIVESIYEIFPASLRNIGILTFIYKSLLSQSALLPR